jgi:hypothetical protein
MAFTDHCDLFGSVHDDGINLVVRHIMRQRPSLFNYATPVFHERPELFCEKIEPAQTVLDAGNPLFTEQEPLPILGTPVPIGINFCVQLTDAEIDFHPGNAINLPPQLRPLPAQRFALRMRACAGLDCPSEDVIAGLLPGIERIVFAQQQVAAPTPGFTAGMVPPADFGRKRDVIVLPTRKLLCFCLELFAVGHFEWGPVTGSQQQWLKPRLDGIEIVDLQPTPMENAIECYATTMLRLGILPRLMVPMEKMIVDITAMLETQGLQIGQQITLQPAAVPADVPNNPAIEENQLKAFIKLTVTEGGA